MRGCNKKQINTIPRANTKQTLNTTQSGSTSISPTILQNVIILRLPLVTHHKFNRTCKNKIYNNHI